MCGSFRRAGEGEKDHGWLGSCGQLLGFGAIVVRIPFNLILFLSGMPVVRFSLLVRDCPSSYQEGLSALILIQILILESSPFKGPQNLERTFFPTPLLARMGLFSVFVDGRDGNRETAR